MLLVKSCPNCGNFGQSTTILKCSDCATIFCSKCRDKYKLCYGSDTFGCPSCSEGCGDSVGRIIEDWESSYK